MAYPVVPVVRSSLLAGQSNGRLEARILSETPGQAGGPGVLLIHPAARAWRALCAAALSNGHVLKASGPQSSFRTYAEQERIFRERYRTAYKANTDVKWWNGQRWYRWYGATAAVPGTSNHGWAMAVDTGEERDGDPGTEAIDTGTVNWLVANERAFGWSHELQSEPWHIRYFAGDAIPAAVLAYEASIAPPPQEDDDEMKHYRPDVAANHPDHGKTFVVNGGIRFHVPSQIVHDQLAAQGLPAVKVDGHYWDMVRASTFEGPDELVERVAEEVRKGG